MIMNVIHQLPEKRLYIYIIMQVSFSREHIAHLVYHNLTLLTGIKLELSNSIL